MCKKCSKCGKIKDESKSSWCKRCHVLFTLKSRQTKEGKEKYKETNKKYRHSAKGKEANRHGNRKHRELHPDRHKARQAVSNALRDGRLQKQPCHCGEIRVQAHHKSYEKDKWLDVEWMCEKHHNELKLERLSDG